MTPDVVAFITVQVALSASDHRWAYNTVGSVELAEVLW
jgi:hypothetical protein